MVPSKWSNISKKKIFYRTNLDFKLGLDHRKTGTLILVIQHFQRKCSNSHPQGHAHWENVFSVYGGPRILSLLHTLAPKPTENGKNRVKRPKNGGGANFHPDFAPSSLTRPPIPPICQSCNTSWGGTFENTQH